MKAIDRIRFLFALLRGQSYDHASYQEAIRSREIFDEGEFCQQVHSGNAKGWAVVVVLNGDYRFTLDFSVENYWEGPKSKREFFPFTQAGVATITMRDKAGAVLDEIQIPIRPGKCLCVKHKDDPEGVFDQLQAVLEAEVVIRDSGMQYFLYSHPLI